MSEGREKHLYSLYRKMRTKLLSFKEVLDVYGFRIAVERPDDCYRVLGMVHSLYKPVPERFKDYIAIPKANGYQSLHTALFGPFGSPIEVQIRTEEMDQVAESGVAAHWMYKIGQPGTNTAQLRVREWVRDLLEMQTHAGDSLEFLEGVKVDLFPKETYVFTPAGEIRALPRGATPVDFAYAVHTDIGNQCIAAKVDGRFAPLRSQLTNGQTVGDCHDAVGPAECGLARFRRHRQGPHGNPQLSQESAHRGGGGARGEAARSGARYGIDRFRGRGGLGGGRADRAAEAPVEGGAVRRDRDRQAARASRRQAAGERRRRVLDRKRIRSRRPGCRSTSAAPKG